MAADGFIFEDRLAIMTTGNISGKRTQTDHSLDAVCARFYYVF
jgi:hypothetical protein